MDAVESEAGTNKTLTIAQYGMPVINSLYAKRAWPYNGWLIGG